MKALKETLYSGTITQGPKVNEFENKFSRVFQVKNAVSLNCGTAALEIAYELVGIKPGDEVITTPLTCAATNIPLLRLGAKIVWADVDEKTLCIDPLDVYAKITQNTTAVVQVHLGGVKADVGKLHIPVVSDACQALGVFNGDLTACSFQAIKSITTADGGMLVCDSELNARKAKLLRWFGIDREQKIKKGWESYRARMMSFDIELPGMKRHMNDLAATMGIVGLDDYAEVLTARRTQFGIYCEKLRGMDGVKIVNGQENFCWLAQVLVERRDDFARMLYEEGVETNIVQVRNDIYKIFGGKRAELPVLNSIENKYISLPIGPHLKEDDIHFICNCIQRGW